MPSRAQAAHYARVVELADAAVGAQLSATAGQGPRRLTSVAMAGAFLHPIDGVSIDNLHDTVNYVNPRGLGRWVTEVIGDEELGAALTEVACDGRAFGLQVHDIKSLIVSRLGQYDAALAEEQALAG